jgi:hypothetical protein
MKQLIIPGFEDYAKRSPKETIEYIYEKGFEWLLDWNSGKFLSKNKFPYVPYRIKFPNDKVLDEGEIFNDFSKLEKRGFSNHDVQMARTFYYAINHDETNKGFYKFSGYTFLSKKDREETIKKYSEKPYFEDLN